MKEIRFGQHSQLKLDLLSNRGMLVSPDFIIEAIRSPDKLEFKEDNKRIAQKNLSLADAFVFPSLKEGWGLVILEAIAHLVYL